MRIFLRKSTKSGKCYAFNQHYISENSDEVYFIISRKKNVIVDICNLLEKYLEK